ncbi:MAG: putative RNA methyltransferase [Alphaproteobacteria bacterium]|nr:MAG: putative RNA methyltransferase [Alphaproteobacteria bacterium]
MTERLQIARLGHRGDGVVDTPDGPLYVPYTLPGETVTVESVQGHPDRRHLLRVEVPSPERVAPVCPHFGICGGCAVQHLTWARYRDWKRGLVVQALAAHELAAEVDDLVDAHGEGRRRAVLHARRHTHDVLDVGFAALKAHHIVPIDRCPVLAPGMAGAVTLAWAVAEALTPVGKPFDIQATATDTGLDVDVRGSGPLPPQRVAELARFAETHRLARLTRHGELVVQRVPPRLQIGPASVVLPPGAFLQATAEGEAALARHVVAHAGRARKVADLFCGVGPFALRLAQTARVTAVDSDAAAVAALRRAADATQGLKPIAAESRDLFRRPLLPEELESFGAVVFDPPRQGAEAQARQLAASRVPLIVAVSCNANTFARDARILVAGGYRLAALTPVDQFRYAAHVEIVARFER